MPGRSLLRASPTPLPLWEQAARTGTHKDTPAGPPAWLSFFLVTLVTAALLFCCCYLVVFDRVRYMLSRWCEARTRRRLAMQLAHNTNGGTRYSDVFIARAMAGGLGVMSVDKTCPECALEAEQPPQQGQRWYRLGPHLWGKDKPAVFQAEAAASAADASQVHHASVNRGYENGDPHAKDCSHQGDQGATDAQPDTMCEAVEAGKCVLCFEGVGDHVMVPCGHGGYCRVCAMKNYHLHRKMCPMCRAAVTRFMQVPLATPVGSCVVVAHYV